MTIEHKGFQVRPFIPPREYEDNPGGYYAKKSDEASHWAAELRRAKDEEAWEHVIASLEARLEQARYVGD